MKRVSGVCRFLFVRHLTLLSFFFLEGSKPIQQESQNHILSKTLSKGHTVDGRNPAPVHMVSIPLFTAFCTSQVVQDFFHQQYLGVCKQKHLVFKGDLPQTGTKNMKQKNE